jgi:hypothetical protein
LTDGTNNDYDELRRRLYQEAAVVDVRPPDQYEGSSTEPDTVAQLRRRRTVPFDAPRVAYTLTETDGVLRWEPGYGLTQAGRRRALRAGLPPSGRIIAPVNFERLEQNEIGGFLEKLDRCLTPYCDLRNPNNGIRQLKNNRWSDVPVLPAREGRVLLFLHGTFSNIQTLIDELDQTPDGRDFLIRAQANYTQVLGFDHSTLALSPLLNALDLSRIFAESKVDIDVVAHSRGGLVARWWLEALDSRQGGQTRAILVGSPLDGTSLAAPNRLRSMLDLFTNISHAVQVASDIGSGGFPFLTVVSGLLRVVSSVTSLATHAPLFDAAFSMIPGLCAQSQVSNNNELLRLNQANSRSIRYFGVRSSFKTDRPGWKFWRYFVDIGSRIKQSGATIIFQDENDLVVNTASMAVLARNPDLLISPSEILDFGENDKVYHTNYFRQKRTARFLAERLDVH